MKLNPATDALIVIDIQNDFCPGGALAVNEGDAIIPGVAALAPRFDTVVITQDWHPDGHASFASTHDQAPFSTTQLAYGEQTLWPDHCVQGSNGAALHADLVAAGVADRATAIVRKGMNPAIDSYSAFFENDKTTATGLAAYLREKGIQRVFLVGLAYDFCVGYSAVDARRLGFEAVVIQDLTRAIAMPMPDRTTTVESMEGQFGVEGVAVIQAADLETPDMAPRRSRRP
jgi:nicotinamidase/pyrazinamidase